MIRGQNRNGCYYSRTEKSKKYYYIRGDRVSRNIAKAQAEGRSKHGKGMISTGINWITSKLAPTTQSNRLVKRLAEFGNIPIVKMQYSRQPISSPINTALNVITLGRLRKKQQELKYDEIFHDSVCIYLANGRKFRLEKNHIVELNDLVPKSTEKLIDIPITRNITLNELVGNASKDADTYKYDHQSSNCQKFANAIVKDSNLDNPEIDKKIEIQDASQLSSVLPKSVNEALNTITNVAGIVSNTVDPIIHGSGLKKRKRPKRKHKKKKVKRGGEVVRTYTVPIFESHWEGTGDDMKKVSGYVQQKRQVWRDPVTRKDIDYIIY